jgi:hypothetical protein
MDLNKSKLVLVCGFALATGGCIWGGGQNSVQDLDAYENPTDSYSVQVNHHHKSGRSATQFEVQQVRVEDQEYVGSAIREDGMGEERIRNTDLPDKPEYQLVGVGTVATDYDVRQFSLRHIFKVDANGRFQVDVAPELSLVQLDSEYQSAHKELHIDMDRAGAGLNFSLHWSIMDRLSLNFTGSRTFYDGSTDSSSHMIYFRLYPTKHFYLDLGKHANYFDFGNDTRLSYERRVLEDGICEPDCRYVYDGTKNSNLVVESIGYRLGIGFDF